MLQTNTSIHYVTFNHSTANITHSSKDKGVHSRKNKILNGLMFLNVPWDNITTFILSGLFFKHFSLLLKEVHLEWPNLAALRGFSFNSEIID